MKTPSNALWRVPACLFLLGCAGYQITTDYDPSADFSDLRTYAWMKSPTPRSDDVRVDNTLLDTRIRNAVDAELARRGYKMVSPEQADFLVGYHAAVQSKVDAYTMGNAYGYRPGWGAGFSDVRVYEYDEGSLIIDVVDPATKQLLWRGAAQAEVDQRASPERREERIRTAVEKILSRFPPQ